MDSTQGASRERDGIDRRRPITTLEEALPGTVLEARDKFGKWFLAKVLNADEEEGEVLVHFSGWSSRFDEWVELSSNRLRTPAKELLEQQELKRRKPLCVGDRIQAKWAGDKRLYFGNITQVFKASSKVEVLFDDGVKVVVPMVDVRKRKQDLVAKTTLAASAVKSASIKALAEARTRRALKRSRDDIQNKSNISPPSSPASVNRKSKKRVSHCTGHDNTAETDSETETSTRNVELSDASAASARVFDETIGQGGEKSQPLPLGENTEPVVAESEEEIKSPGKGWRRKLFPDTLKRSHPLRTTEVQLLGQASSDQSCPPMAPSYPDVEQEESRSLKLKKDQHEVALPPNSTELMPPKTFLHSPNSDVTTPFQPSFHDSKAGSDTLQSRPQVIVGPVPKLVQQDREEVQDKAGAGKRVHSSLRKRSFLRSVEADSGTDCTPHSRQHGTRSRPPLPETKKRRPSTGSSMVTRTQKRVERNIIKSAHERPSHLAPKEHVVVWDHNDFKCHFTGCNKSFRKETLLSSHLRHYHNIGDKTDKPVVKVMPKPKPIISKPPAVISKPPAVISKPPAVISKPPTVVSKPPAVVSKPPAVISKPLPDTGGTSLKSPVQETKKSVETVTVSPPSNKQEGIVDATSKRKTAVKGSPRKAKVKAELDKSPSLDAVKSTSVVPTVVMVPGIETAGMVCQGLITHEAVPVVKHENSELYRQRGNLRTVPRTSLSEELDEDILTEEETEEDEGMRNKDDVVHCICGSSVDEGFMIQCDQCLCWQHGECIGISQYNLPDKYLCPVCSNPPGMRQRMKHKYSQMWFAEGHLPSLPGGPPFQHQGAMALSHQISDILHRIRKMLHCTKIKIQALNSPNHPYLKQWAKECSQMTAQEIQALLLRTIGPTMCSTSCEPPTATDPSQQPVLNGLTHHPALSSSLSLPHPFCTSPTTHNNRSGQSESPAVSTCAPSLSVIPHDSDVPSSEPLFPHTLESSPRTHLLASSSGSHSTELMSPPPLRRTSALSSPQTVNARTARQGIDMVAHDVLPAVSVASDQPLVTNQTRPPPTQDGHAMETGQVRTTVIIGDDPEQMLSNEFGVQETSVFALEGGSGSAKAETRNVGGIGKDEEKHVGQKALLSSTSISECYVESGNRCLSGSEESVFAPDPVNPEFISSLDHVNKQGDEESSISTYAEAIIAEAAVELSLGLRGLDPGHWFNRLVLLDHINKVQDKVLCWMDSLDKKIDSLPAGWSGDMSEHHTLLTEVHHSIQELEKLRKGCSCSPIVT